MHNISEQDFIWKQVLTETIKLKWGEGVLTALTSSFKKGGEGTVDMYRGMKTQKKMHTEGRQGENTQGEHSHVAEGVQPRNAKNWQQKPETGRTKGDSPLEPWEGAWPNQTKV